MTQNHFSDIDIVFFVVSLCISVCIGSWHARKSLMLKSDSTSVATEEYLMAGRSMSAIPITLSVVASSLSGITVLGASSEAYANGAGYSAVFLCTWVVFLITAFIFVPFYYRINITTAYEYLERRFDSRVRTIACLFFLLQVMFYLALVLTTPALALNVVTGWPVWSFIVILGIISIGYTAFGGMRAVIWTDCYQFVVLCGGVVATFVVAVHRSGGIAHVYKVALHNNRLNVFDMTVNPYQRINFFNVIIGCSFIMLSQFATQQTSVQRLVTAKSKKVSQISVLLMAPLSSIIIILMAATGITLWVYYEDKGDPVHRHFITRPDQILPYFVITVLNFGGLPGLFCAALCASTLSTVGSGLNSLATAAMVDILESAFQRTYSDKRRLYLVRLFTFGFGVLIVLLAFVVQMFGTLNTVSNDILGAGGGPLLGVFLLGMLTKRVNAQGALCGLMGGVLLSLWVAIGKLLQNPPAFFALAPMSFTLTAAFGAICTFVIGFFCSFLAAPPESHKILGLCILGGNELAYRHVNQEVVEEYHDDDSYSNDISFVRCER